MRSEHSMLETEAEGSSTHPSPGRLALAPGSVTWSWIQRANSSQRQRRSLNRPSLVDRTHEHCPHAMQPPGAVDGHAAWGRCALPSLPHRGAPRPRCRQGDRGPDRANPGRRHIGAPVPPAGAAESAARIDSRLSCHPPPRHAKPRPLARAVVGVERAHCLLATACWLLLAACCPAAEPGRGV